MALMEKYLYNDPLDFLINTQMEKVKFETYRVSSQLESVNKRLYLIHDEGKINLLLFAGIFLVYGISFAGLQSYSVICRLIFAVPYNLSLFALIFLTPVLIYKSLNAFFLYYLNLHSPRYVQLMKKMGIRTYEEERRDCVRILTRYESYMKQLEEWKESNSEGKLLLTEQELLEEFEKMDLTTQIPVTNPHSGKLASFTKAVTVIMWFLPLIVAIIAIIKLAQGM